jgi:hypothetical protein
MADKLDVPSLAAYAQSVDKKTARAAITVTAVPVDGEEGVAYDGFTVGASGAYPPYRFLMAEGSNLPSGLFLDADTGAVTGTPDTAGSYTFRVRVFDAARRMVYTKPLTVNIAE